LRYRPEIDGLRAIAVIPVILSHANFALFSGGFIGVDVFFVVSGYLITTIIHREIQDGSFSIIRFYERRIRRILPALFFVSLVSIPFAWLWLMPVGFDHFSQSLAAVYVFASNIYFEREAGYFATASELKPLIHTWSLAVEEQFYVFFPLLLLLFRNITRNRLLMLFVVLVVASLGLAQWGSKAYPVANYFLLPTRAWELGVGAMLAISVNTWIQRDGWSAEFFSIIGLSMIFYAVVVFDKSTPFPSFWGLVPVLGTALVIAFARPQTVVGRVLGWRPIVGLGLISYSAYLWYQPIFSFARIRMLYGVSGTAYLALSVLAFIMAYFSWRYVERPFRNKAKFSRRQVFSGAAVISMTFIGFGLAGNAVGLNSGRTSSAAAQMAAWGELKNTRTDECLARPEKFIPPVNSCVYGDEKSPQFAIMGDSHADAIAPQFAEILSKYHQSLRELTYGGCAPAVGYRLSDGIGECPKYNSEVRNFLMSANGPDVVVLLARWTWYIEGKPFDNQEGGIESSPTVYALPLDKDASFISDPNRIGEIGELYRASIEYLLDNGKRVVLVYPVPEVGWNVPLYLANEINLQYDRQEPLTTSYNVFMDRVKNTRIQLDLLKDDKRLIRIRPEEIFCNTVVPERCVAQLDGKPLYFDDDHLNSIGAAMLSKKITEAMMKRGWLSDLTGTKLGLLNTW
jgi:peptidoglycan/LPS O-acetylase OafA/YrhL